MHTKAKTFKPRDMHVARLYSANYNNNFSTQISAASSFLPIDYRLQPLSTRSFRGTFTKAYYVASPGFLDIEPEEFLVQDSKVTMNSFNAILRQGRSEKFNG